MSEDKPKVPDTGQTGSDKEKIDLKALTPVPSTGRGAGRPPDEAWIKSASRSEIIELISRLAEELKSRATHDATQKVAQPDTGSFGIENLNREVSEFIPLPVGAKKDDRKGEAAVWRLVLISSNATHPPLGIEVHGDITLGRKIGDSRPDFDLNEYDAEKLGVSRLHAMIRPTKDEVLLADLGSLNGTLYNGERIKFNEPRPLKNMDTISFGTLHFKVRSVTKLDE